MKRCFALLMALVLVFALCACGSEEQEQTGLHLWFVEDSSAAEVFDLASEMYSGEQSVPAVMEALLAGPSFGSGLVSPIPEGVELLSWSQEGRMLYLDLSGPYDKLNGLELTLADYCIALTLTQLEGVDGVCIKVNGKLLPQRQNQFLTGENVLFSGAEEEPVNLTAALHFRRAGGNELGAELRVFRLTESESATLAVLQALVAGPREAGLAALLPQNITVYSARVENGVCYADFSVGLLEQVPESEVEQALVLRSIVESLCELGHVQAVQILVEGEQVQWYGTQDISQPLD